VLNCVTPVEEELLAPTEVVSTHLFDVPYCISGTYFTDSRVLQLVLCSTLLLFRCNKKPESHWPISGSIHNLTPWLASVLAVP